MKEVFNMDNIDIMDINNYDYFLPEELIAQSPAKERDHSRLMVLNKSTHEISHHHFYDIVSYLHQGDVLVRNNSKVIPARLIGVKEVTLAKVEVLLLKDLGDNVWECLCGNAHVIKLGTIISFGNGELKAECVEILDEGIRHMKLIYQGILFEILDQLGKMPLPPYIKKQCDDNSRYQTVYAKVEGSAAAPTAGFHFTEEIFAELKAKGVEVVDVTLHVGLGTFRPVKVNNIHDHHMHSEMYEMSQETADILNKAKSEGRRIIAIGTTSTRTLESVYQKYHTFKACHEETSIFIYPGYQFQAIDALITNFHLPKSTLIMLVSAFAGRKFILDAYKKAVEEKYRFFSFGDAMFIYGDQ
jgi:S-adenosylmethionine:tRNA ribosyltransferase-isomerase